MQSFLIVPNLHQLQIRYANIHLAVEKTLTLVDTGFRGSMAAVFHFIRSLGRSPEEIALVVLTHNHLDHAGSVGELRRLANARVVAHRADVVIPAGQTPYPPEHLLGRVLRTPVGPAFRRFLVLAPDGVSDVLQGGETFDVLGGMQVVHTPGHTAGSISLYFPRHKLLMVGDALNHAGGSIRLPLKPVSLDMKLAAESVRRMAELDVEILCFGHGRPVAVGAHQGLRALARRIEGDSKSVL